MPSADTCCPHCQSADIYSQATAQAAVVRWEAAARAAIGRWEAATPPLVLRYAPAYAVDATVPGDPLLYPHLVCDPIIEACARIPNAAKRWRALRRARDWATAAWLDTRGIEAKLWDGVHQRIDGAIVFAVVAP